MKRLIILSLTAFFLFSTPFSAFPKEAVQIDVLYMNHGPLRPTLRELEKLFDGYGDKVAVHRYDFYGKAAERFKTEKGIKEHTPLMIWIDGHSTIEMNGTPVTFRGFPTGSGPVFFQGKWDMDTLKNALDRATNSN